MMTVLAAPSRLDLDARSAFRRAAQAALAALPEGGTLVVDLSDTLDIDSAGLGTLVVVQRAAASRDQGVRLIGVRPEIVTLLTVTRLIDLFAIERAGGR